MKKMGREKTLNIIVKIISIETNKQPFSFAPLKVSKTRIPIRAYIKQLNYIYEIIKTFWNKNREMNILLILYIHKDSLMIRKNFLNCRLSSCWIIFRVKQIHFHISYYRNMYYTYIDIVKNHSENCSLLILFKSTTRYFWNLCAFMKV